MTKILPIPRPDTKIELSDGSLFDPMNPHGYTVSYLVIARALSNICRFGGQVNDFYSNGQHSVLVAALSDPSLQTQKVALLHDADECFGLPDMVSQLKAHFPDFVATQKNIGHAIFEMFDLPKDAGKDVKPADRMALALERRHLKSSSNQDHWGIWEKGLGQLPNIGIIPLPPKDAYRLTYRAFKRVFEEHKPITPEWITRTQGFRTVSEKAYIPAHI